MLKEAMLPNIREERTSINHNKGGENKEIVVKSEWYIMLNVHK